MNDVEARDLARRVAAAYSSLPEVEAVAWGGSHATGRAQASSDIDLYVYSREEVPLSSRHDIATREASHAEVGNAFWEPGDEWLEAESGTKLDVMFRSCGWVEGELRRVLEHHRASVGYTTSIWQNVRTSMLLFDRTGWYAELKRYSDQPYPEALRRAVVAKNFPLLRDTLSSYPRQVEHALARDDAITVNHRVAAFLASYFDVLFALNRLPHPGEKRLLVYAEACEHRPANMVEDVGQVLTLAGGVRPELTQALEQLVERLEHCLRRENLW